MHRKKILEGINAKPQLLLDSQIAFVIYNLFVGFIFFIFFKDFIFKSSLYPMWGSNSQPPNQELHAIPTEPARSVDFK